MGDSLKYFGMLIAIISFSIMISWAYFLLAVPLMFKAVSSGWIGFLVTFIALHSLSDVVSGSLEIANATMVMGLVFSLTFWLVLRKLNSTAF